MEKYSVIRYQESYSVRWNDFNKNSINGSFLFDRDFMEYQERFTDHSLIVMQGKDIVALLPATEKASTLQSHKGLTYGGLVYLDLRLEEVIEIFRLILLYLNERMITYFKISLIPTIYHKKLSGDLDYVLFLAEALLSRRDTLSVCEPARKIGFSTLRRRRSRKAVDSGLAVVEDQNFEAFWNQVLIPNLSKKHQVQPVHTLEEILVLASRFPDNIRQFNVYDGDRIIAGTTIFENDTVAHAQYISTFGGEANGALDLLFTYLIEQVYAHKPYFDFGISNERDGTVLNKGLVNWKQGFGAGTVVHDFYELPTSAHKKLVNVFI